ncbi:glycosyltransferase family 4 protein [Patescibacteria group bacterium]|nr:glycosyltransferase family 4 protein [Patescibacteria group bacterium]MBU1674071.1 glycosyltransferase family 4 protein [Patescibacteria group bacterium]MBU1963780.1 glycosyltransferase family 4 protein [Patescibacteria group bacterium]
MKVLFISRKYLPQVGGMEQFSYGLVNSINCPKKKIILAKSQKHLIWWIPWAWIKAIFMARSCDVIHLGDGVLAWLGASLKKITKKPVTITVHGLDVVWPKKFYQKHFVSKLKKLDMVFCVSNATMEEARKRGVPEEKLMYIPNGVYPEKFQTNERFDFGDFKILLTLGRLVKRKGVYWFCENVVPDLPENYLYIVVGTGPEEERIKALLKEKNLEQKVRMMGYVPDNKLAKMINSSHVFVMPNIPVKGDREGFGIVALEAGSQGLPVVASSIEGITDAIVPGQNGFLVEPKNAEAFKDTIEGVINTRDYDGLRQQIETYVKKNYAWSVVSNRYLEEFDRLLDHEDSK